MLPGGKPKTRTHSSGVASRACRRATPKWDAIARRSARSTPRRSVTTGSHLRAPFDPPPFEPPLEPFEPPPLPDAPSALATGSMPTTVVSPATITPMLLTAASGAIPSPRAAGPASTPSSMTVGSPPALGNRSASAAATSAGVSGVNDASSMTLSSMLSFSNRSLNVGDVLSTSAIRTVLSTSTSPMNAAAGRASSKARSAASARADGSRARLSPNSRPGRIRSKTLASCAPYATCDSVSGRLDQSPHRSRLSSGCPSSAWHTDDSPGCDP
mmetsp:Transcript_2289/g.8685  ORF Transcript_2289/g.8685 Transcript_2289/m.8685 type:complete len:271 (+) Transcript_2289:1101-1913(+)